MFEAVHEGSTRAAEPLAHLRASASALVERVAECADWSGSERSAALTSLDLVAAQLSRARARLLVAERDAGTSQRPGDRSFEAARARLTRTGTAEATREVRQADALVSMPAVADAVGDGRVPLGHLDVLARVAATASPEVAQVLRSADMQATVVQLASAQSAPDFARSLAQLAAAQDPQALEDSHEAARRERSLVLSHQARGTYLKGFLDRVAGEALQAALDSTGQAPDETRSPAQANADALVALARRACAGLEAGPAAAGGATAPGAGSRPHVSLIVPAETFAALRDHQRSREAVVGPEERAVMVDDLGSVGSTSPAPVAWAPVVPATLEDGTPVAMSELAQALCDCEIARIVMSAEGVPLDLGRTKRTYAGVHRRAVVARDRQCAWNGCHTSARWSQVHHSRWWDRDRGSTSIENGVLLCDYHHHEVHRLDLTIERHASRRVLSGRPPDAEPPFAPMRYTFRRRRDGRTINAPDVSGGTDVRSMRDDARGSASRQ
ncbi:DUF222 domain-containing protein [Cellulomonas humilata]|uniref:DUF222 domain-containing protein n=1 Tax=Cellulomonas humilata TaxID=144055 RepID=A0A7Y6DZP4_9CELL|nr:HNH endonuclease signature motif containing protein [Cellulomonas humilata]NUU19342.1 DUF222 domain-containing protein [Cellulomonas humilata]